MKFFILILFIVFTQLASSKTIDTINQKSSLNTSIKADTIFNQPTDTFQVTLQKKSIVPTKIVVMNNNDENLWVSVGLPIFTFALGILFPLMIQFLTERKKSKDVLNRWVAEIGNLEYPINEQINTIDKFLSEQTDFKMDISRMVVIGTLQCSNFESMDKGDFLKAIKTYKAKEYSEAVKISNSTIGYIGVLVHTHKVLKDKFQEYLDGTSKQISEFNIHFVELYRSFTDYGVEIEKETAQNPSLNPHFNQMLELFSIHVYPKRETGDYNAFTLENDFFVPLMKILSSLMFDDRVKPITLNCSNCSLAIKAMKMERTYVRENLNKISETYNNQLLDLERVLNDLKI